jgi:hypothetical protein
MLLYYFLLFIRWYIYYSYDYYYMYFVIIIVILMEVIEDMIRITDEYFGDLNRIYIIIYRNIRGRFINIYQRYF